MNMHSVFHHMLLFKEKPSNTLRSQQLPPPPVIMDGQPEYEVEEILDSIVEDFLLEQGVELEAPSKTLPTLLFCIAFCILSERAKVCNI